MVQMNLFSGQEYRCRNWKCVMGVGRGYGVNWEMGIYICKYTYTHIPSTIGKIDSGKLLYSPESSAWYSVIT